MRNLGICKPTISTTVRVVFLTVLSLVAGVGSSLADVEASRQTCSGDEAAVLAAVIAAAKDGLVRSMDSIDAAGDVDIRRFTLWFGAPSKDTAAQVRRVFERALNIVSTQTYWCPVATDEDLKFEANL